MRPPSVKPGEKHGSLTVIKLDGLKSGKGQRHRYYLCRCACGRSVSVQGRLLKSGNSTSCGCKLAAYQKSLEGRPECDAAPGQKWNRLTFIKWLYTEGHAAVCEFKCECGKTVSARLSDVKHGSTKSCGCLLREIAKKMGSFYGAKLRLKPGISGFNRLYRRYRYCANQRRLSFEMTKEEFQQKTKEACYYCGKEPVASEAGSSNPGTHYAYNGLDRTNNGKGYTAENTVSCCADCNRAKRCQTQPDFIAWAKRIAARFA